MTGAPIYLIKELWTDSMENFNNVGYSPIGYTTDLLEAKRIVAKYRVLKSTNPYCLKDLCPGQDFAPRFQFEEISAIYVSEG